MPARTSTPVDREARWWIVVFVVTGLGCCVCLVRLAISAYGVYTKVSTESRAMAPVGAPSDSAAPSVFSQWSSPVDPESQTVFQPWPTNVIEHVVPPKVSRDEYVHKQADWLRQVAKDPKLSRAVGNLTLQQIDEMEAKGITVQ